MQLSYTYRVVWIIIYFPPLPSSQYLLYSTGHPLVIVWIAIKLQPRDRKYSRKYNYIKPRDLNKVHLLVTGNVSIELGNFFASLTIYYRYEFASQTIQSGILSFFNCCVESYQRNRHLLSGSRLTFEIEVT